MGNENRLPAGASEAAKQPIRTAEAVPLAALNISTLKQLGGYNGRVFG